MLDRQGNPVHHANPAAVAAYDEAVAAFSLYRGDPLAALDTACAAAPGAALPPTAKALILALATEPAAAADARALLAEAAPLPQDSRSTAMAAITAAVLDGEWTRAALLADRHNIDHPRDLLALQAGHLIDFFRANARSLRDRVARALPAWPAALPGRSAVLGMYSFGLEEAGDYAQAEATGRTALDAEPGDSWAHHAVAHVMEMQGRAEDGIGWMIARESHWAAEECFFRVHNWWHRALYHLDLGQTGAALNIYDRQVRATPSAIAVDLVDAAALLWRLDLSGADVSGRWAEVADTWGPHADGSTYPFNDWHACLADLGAGREAQVATRLARMKQAAAGPGETARWIGSIGIPLVEGFAAFHRGAYAAAAETLHPVRAIANAFGGSHAQRDLIDWTLAEAALRSGNRRLSEALVAERLALKPHSPFTRGLMQRARQA